jgi:hypothetical protein
LHEVFQLALPVFQLRFDHLTGIVLRRTMRPAMSLDAGISIAMYQGNGIDVSCRLVAEGARIVRMVPTDGKSDRHGHLTYG